MLKFEGVKKHYKDFDQRAGRPPVVGGPAESRAGGPAGRPAAAGTGTSPSSLTRCHLPCRGEALAVG